MIENGMFPYALNTSSLTALIQNLSTEAREALFNKLGWTSEDDLNQLVGHGNTGLPLDMDEAEKMQYPEYRARQWLRLYVPPVLLVLGTFGNVCSFLILRHKAMARQSTPHFLAVLAVLDSCVLYVGLFRQWLGELTGRDLKNQGPWLCKVVVILGYTCSNVAVWIIVAVTVERYIVVCHPLKASRVCSVTRAKRAVMGIVLLFLCINLHFLWTAGLTWQQQEQEEDDIGKGHAHCSSQEGHDFLISAVWPWVDAFLYGFSPFLIIISLNVVIIVHLVKATSGRAVLQNRCPLRSPMQAKKPITASSSSSKNCSSQRQLLSLSRSSSNCSNCSLTSMNGASHTSLSSLSTLSSGNASSTTTITTAATTATAATTTSNCLTVPGARACCRSRSQRGSGLQVLHTRRVASNSSLRMTVMLLTVSFTFLITTLPMNVCVIASAFWNRQWDDTGRMMRHQLVFAVAELLMYVNHSVNFFLYCATGHKFRTEMMRLMCGKKRSGAFHFDHSHHIYCSRNGTTEGFTEIPNSETGL